MSKPKSHKRRARPVEQKSASQSLNLWGLDAFFAANTIAGPTITPETAMRCTTVARAVSLISDTAGNVPAKLYVEDGKGGKEPDPAHPAFKLVHDAATPFMSAAQLRTQLTADALLHGNGVARANRLGDGRIVELNRLDPRSVTVETDDRGEPHYRVANRTMSEWLSWTDVLHIPAFSFDGVNGVAPIHLAREAIALALVMEQMASALFANGGRPGGVITFPEKVKLTPDAVGKMKGSWQSAHGAGKSGGTAIFEQGGRYEQFPLSLVDAQFLELKTKQIDEIGRAFNVPPSMLFELGRATWSISETMNTLFMQMTLLPWLRKWTDAYTRLLLTPEERATRSIDFIIDDLARGDLAARATAYAQFRAMEVMTANDVRRRENLPALKDGDDLRNPNTSVSTASPAQGAETE